MNDVVTYRIKLAWQISETEINTSLPLQMSVEQTEAQATLWSVSTDQSGLVGLIRHLHGNGFVLLSIERIDHMVV